MSKGGHAALLASMVRQRTMKTSGSGCKHSAAKRTQKSSSDGTHLAGSSSQPKKRVRASPTGTVYKKKHRKVTGNATVGQFDYDYRVYSDDDPNLPMEVPDGPRCACKHGCRKLLKYLPRADALAGKFQACSLGDDRCACECMACMPHGVSLPPRRKCEQESH